MKKKHAMAVGLVIIACNACTPPPQSDDGLMLRMRSDSWENALNAGNVDELVDFYTDSSRVLPPNAELSAGDDAVRAHFGGMIGAGLGGTLTTIEARECGDIGYNVGLYSLADPSGTSVDRGKFVEIWRRDTDGMWRISNDIWNSDLPAAPLTHEEPPADATTLTLIHEVDDAEHWLAAWRGADGRRAMFRANGARHVHVFRDDANPNRTGLVVSVADMPAFERFLASDAVREAAAEDGVRMETLQVFHEVE